MVWFDSTTIIYSLMSHLVAFWLTKPEQERAAAAIAIQQSKIVHNRKRYWIDLVICIYDGLSSKTPLFYSSIQPFKIFVWKSNPAKNTMNRKKHGPSPFSWPVFFFAIQIIHVNQSNRKNINSFGWFWYTVWKYIIFDHMCSASNRNQIY